VRRYLRALCGTERLLQRKMRRASLQLHLHLRLQSGHEPKLQERESDEHGSEAGLQRAVSDQLQLGVRQHGVRDGRLPADRDVQLTG
jgi:hypothetical protein